MIERFFGKKSTGYVYIISASVLFLSLIAYGLAYLLYSQGTVMGFVGYTLLGAFVLSIISLPIVLQKRFKVYFPHFIQIWLCIYVALYYVNQVIYSYRTGALNAILPLLGGFVIAMAVFSCVYTAAIRIIQKSQRKISVPLLVLTSFGISVAAVLFWRILEYVIYISFFKENTNSILKYLSQVSLNSIGIFLFCIFVIIQMYVGNSAKYVIRSFKNSDEALKIAVDANIKSFYRVISNDAQDTVNYRQVFKSAKSKFLSGKLIYLALYVSYLAYLIINYFRGNAINLFLLISLIAAFVLNVIATIYEYILFKKGIKTKRLFALKIIKSAIRIGSLLLTIAVLFQADYEYNEVTAIVSLVMIFVNVAVLITSIRGRIKLRKRKD